MYEKDSTRFTILNAHNIHVYSYSGLQFQQVSQLEYNLTGYGLLMSPIIITSGHGISCLSIDVELSCRLGIISINKMNNKMNNLYFTLIDGYKVGDRNHIKLELNKLQKFQIVLRFYGCKANILHVDRPPSMYGIVVRDGTCDTRGKLCLQFKF